MELHLSLMVSREFRLDIQASPCVARHCSTRKGSKQSIWQFLNVAGAGVGRVDQYFFESIFLIESIKFVVVVFSSLPDSLTASP